MISDGNTLEDIDTIHKKKNVRNQKIAMTWLFPHTNTPVRTIPSTSASLVNKVAKELKETPKTAAKQTPVSNPIWKDM